MITLQPIAEAIDKISSKTLVGSTLKSAEWARVPVEIRDRALFSSRVENARVLDRVKTGLTNMLTGTRNEFGIIEDRSKFIADLRDLATREGLSPTNPALKNTIQDVTSRARADLILRTQTEMAYGFARHKRGLSEPALRASPAQELVRIIDSRVKRDWVDTWRSAGGRTFAGNPAIGGQLQEGISGIRCIALKTDPIWVEISRFGNPYPPFDFNSGIGVNSVGRGTALELGLIAPGQELTAPEPKLNDNLEVDLGNMDSAVRNELLRGLGNLVEMAGSILRWKGAAP